MRLTFTIFLSLLAFVSCKQDVKREDSPYKRERVMDSAVIDGAVFNIDIITNRQHTAGKQLNTRHFGDSLTLEILRTDGKLAFSRGFNFNSFRFHKTHDQGSAQNDNLYFQLFKKPWTGKGVIFRLAARHNIFSLDTVMLYNEFTSVAYHHAGKELLQLQPFWSEDPNENLVTLHRYTIIRYQQNPGKYRKQMVGTTRFTYDNKFNRFSAYEILSAIAKKEPALLTGIDVAAYELYSGSVELERNYEL